MLKVMKSVPSENILKLRELTCDLAKTHPNEYKVIIQKLKKIIDEGKTEIDGNACDENKIKCYETMCVSIMTLIKSIEI